MSHFLHRKPAVLATCFVIMESVFVCCCFTEKRDYPPPPGHYMYVEASSHRRGQKAQLISPSQPSTAGACLRFWYHMYGSTMGTFNLYLRQGGQITNTIFSMSGNQGNRWIQAELTVKSPSSSWQVSWCRGGVACFLVFLS